MSVAVSRGSKSALPFNRVGVRLRAPPPWMPTPHEQARALAGGSVQAVFVRTALRRPPSMARGVSDSQQPRWSGAVYRNPGRVSACFSLPALFALSTPRCSAKGISCPAQHPHRVPILVHHGSWLTPSLVINCSVPQGRVRPHRLQPVQRRSLALRVRNPWHLHTLWLSSPTSSIPTVAAPGAVHQAVHKHV